MIQTREELTAADREKMQHEKDMFDRQATHVQQLKRMELELAYVEAKWLSWLRLPMLVIKLPILMIFGVAYCIALTRKHEPSENFWQFLNK